MYGRKQRRLARARRRHLILKALVRWWKAADYSQRVAVMAEARVCWPDDTRAAAAECNLYEDAQQYLEANGRVEVGGRWLCARRAAEGWSNSI